MFDVEDGIQPNANVYNALLDAYKRYPFTYSFFFENILFYFVLFRLIWFYLIVCRNGKEDKVKAVEEEIKRKNIKTNTTSYSSSIEDFVNTGDIEKGMRILLFFPSVVLLSASFFPLFSSFSLLLF